MVRLGLQGVELMETGNITLPVPEPSRQWLRDLRVGKHTMQEALDLSVELEQKSLSLVGRSALPPKPDRCMANNWLIEVYQDEWEWFS